MVTGMGHMGFFLVPTEGIPWALGSKGVRKGNKGAGGGRE